MGSRKRGRGYPTATKLWNDPKDWISCQQRRSQRKRRLSVRQTATGAGRWADSLSHEKNRSRGSGGPGSSESGAGGDQRCSSERPCAMSMPLEYCRQAESRSDWSTQRSVVKKFHDFDADYEASTCSLQKNCGKPKSLRVLTRPNALDWRILSPMCGFSRESGSFGRARPPRSMCSWKAVCELFWMFTESRPSFRIRNSNREISLVKCLF